MKKQIGFWFVGLIVFCLFGCDSKSKDITATNSTLNSVSSNESGVVAHNSETISDSNNASKPQAPAIDLSKIPAELKSDAYEYYGLGRTDPIKMTVTQNEVTKPATQVVRLTNVSNSAAEFTITNDGGLQELGEVMVSLSKEGIRIVSVKGKKADSDTFELPSGLVPGKSWPFKLETDDQKLTGSNVVKGTEPVTTSVETYKDALLIISTASGSQNGQKIQLNSKQWLVKGRGQVKAEITYVSGKNKQTVTMSEIK